MSMLDHQQIELRDRSILVLLRIMKLDGVRVEIAPTEISKYLRILK